MRAFRIFAVVALFGFGSPKAVASVSYRPVPVAPPPNVVDVARINRCVREELLPSIREVLQSTQDLLDNLNRLDKALDDVFEKAK